METVVRFLLRLLLVSESILILLIPLPYYLVNGAFKIVFERTEVKILMKHFCQETRVNKLLVNPKFISLIMSQVMKMTNAKVKR